MEIPKQPRLLLRQKVAYHNQTMRSAAEDKSLLIHLAWRSWTDAYLNPHPYILESSVQKDTLYATNGVM